MARETFNPVWGEDCWEVELCVQRFPEDNSQPGYGVSRNVYKRWCYRTKAEVTAKLESLASQGLHDVGFRPIPAR